jgi:hypothetical protein
VVLIGLDQNGDTIWTCNHGGTSNEYFGSAMLINNNEIIVSGITDSHIGSIQSAGLYLMKQTV